MKVARTVLKERCPQAIEASTLIKNLQDRLKSVTERDFKKTLQTYMKYRKKDRSDA